MAPIPRRSRITKLLREQTGWGWVLDSPDIKSNWQINKTEGWGGAERQSPPMSCKLGDLGVTSGEGLGRLPNLQLKGPKERMGDLQHTIGGTVLGRWGSASRRSEQGPGKLSQDVRTGEASTGIGVRWQLGAKRPKRPPSA